MTAKALALQSAEAPLLHPLHRHSDLSFPVAASGFPLTCLIHHPSVILLRAFDPELSHCPCEPAQWPVVLTALPRPPPGSSAPSPAPATPPPPRACAAALRSGRVPRVRGCRGPPGPELLAGAEPSVLPDRSPGCAAVAGSGDAVPAPPAMGLLSDPVRRRALVRLVLRLNAPLW